MNRLFPSALVLIRLAIVHPCAAQATQTTLSDPAIKFKVPDKPYIILKRGPLEAIIVDNRAVDDATLKGHRAGYSGVASLTHQKQPRNLFVPAVAGLNFEHIHDGTTQPRPILFEPRNFPMELRIIDEHTVELYQKPTPHWGLESCQRFHILDNGAIELVIECIPRKRVFKNNYIGLFWASYIDQPQSTDIHFLGRAETDGATPPRWMRASSSAHGVDALHLAANDIRTFPHEADFPLTLVFNRSKYRFIEPWYFGVSNDMAFAQIFRKSDQVRFSQSPSGGGQRNPAWDFQFFIPDYQLDRLYRFTLRAVYTPMSTPDQLRKSIQPHLAALNRE